MIRLWADFHRHDRDGNVPLGTHGSDLSHYRDRLRPGLHVIVYDSVQEVEGDLILTDGRWSACIDEATWKSTGDANLAREMRGWGFPPVLGYTASRFLVALVRDLYDGREIGTGRLEALRQRHDLHPLEAETLVRSLIEFDGERVAGVAGLSRKEYPHRVRIGERQLFAWCPFDAIAAAILLHHPVRVESACPETGVPIQIELTPDAVTSVEPESAVFRQVEDWAEEHPLETYLDIQDEFCSRQYLFRDGDALVSWSRAKEDVFVSTRRPTDTLHLAQLAWKDPIRYGVTAATLQDPRAKG